jgi:hypothetical protein
MNNNELIEIEQITKKEPTINWISKIAYYRNIRNEIPNEELARELAETNNTAGIKEISTYLFDKNSSISSDSLKVLYEIGYLKPELIQVYIDTFISLLDNKNNRMIWGGMIALSTIAHLKADDIFKKIDLVLLTMKKGSLITEVAGIKTLVKVAMKNERYKEKLLPVLFEYMEKARPIDFATRIETILPLIHSPEEKDLFERIIDLKSTELSKTQLKKLITIINRFNKKQ